MREDSPQWHDVGQPASPAEAEALRAIKAMLPDGAIAWAWSNVSFISVNGRLAETDVRGRTFTSLSTDEGPTARDVFRTVGGALCFVARVAMLSRPGSRR